MILHRFCSAKEYEAFQRGDLLVNNKNHSIKRGSASTSVGFCFFKEDPEDAKHWLSGIVDFDVCITVEVDDSDVMSQEADMVRQICEERCIRMNTALRRMTTIDSG